MPGVRVTVGCPASPSRQAVAQDPPGHRPQLVNHLDQHGQLVQRGQCPTGPGRVDAFIEFDPHEGGRDRVGQPRYVGDIGERGLGEQPLQRAFDLLGPQPQRRGNRGGQPLLVLCPGQQLRQHRDVTQPLLLGVDGATQIEQFAQ